MITRQTTNATLLLLNQPLVKYYYEDSDEEMTEVFKLPILDKMTHKEWFEKVFSKIRHDKLASYVSQRLYISKCMVITQKDFMQVK